MLGLGQKRCKVSESLEVAERHYDAGCLCLHIDAYRTDISDCKGVIILITFPRTVMEATLFSNAECSEDEIEYVIGSGGPGDGVERAQGAVEIKQQHFVGNFVGDGGGSGAGATAA